MKAHNVIHDSYLYKMSILGSSCHFVQSVGTDLDSYLISPRPRQKKELTRHMLSSVASFSPVMTAPLQIHTPGEPWMQGTKPFAKRELEPAWFCGLESKGERGLGLCGGWARGG